MKNLKIKIIALLFAFTSSLYAQQTPGEAQKGVISIIGATAHIGNGEIIENSLIIFENGKIKHVVDATTSKLSPMGKIIDASGKHIYPGFIAANTTLGLVEIDAIRPSNDEDEIGEMLPHVRSIAAYNAESLIVESMRPNGVLVAQIAPRGGRISGTSSIVQLDAWNWEDAVIKENDGIHINWPNSFRRGRTWRGEEPGIKPNEDYTKEINELTDFFKNAKAYLAGKRNPKHLPFEAMEAVFSGDKKIFVQVDGEKEIIDVINFKKENNLANIVIVGGYHANKVAHLLKQEQIPVLVQRVHSLPSQEDDSPDHPFKLAVLLHQNGVLTGLQTSGDMERMNTRNLPFYAGTTVAYGLAKEEALKLITSNVAKILGMEKTLGTLETGKDATFFISEGDALDMRTNKVTLAFIQGREISLDTYQKDLYERYEGKYKK
ncbi:MAG TPA: amidohydrolase family protein [Salinimicrobium sp.]|nr:amidohydrolase family protein [Salinimicrobium sp.]